MGINTALYNGVSGLNNFATAMGVVSDNIANSNTTAFKSNTIHFGDLVNTYYSLSTNDTEGAGAGSSVMGIATNYAQGTFIGTSSWSDLAISGDGFFTVVDPATNRTYYTRDGSFHMDGDGYVVNAQGFRVQGYELDADSNIVGAGADLQIPDAESYVSISVTTDGNFVGVDNTGAEIPLCKVSLATFSNNDGLVRQGGNLYITGPEVGQTFDNAGNPDLFGQVVDFSLEGSNVDMAQEMVNMIIYQAAYNANSKTITTSKDMIDTSINMVR